jgi:hypothetical protein
VAEEGDEVPSDFWEPLQLRVSPSFVMRTTVTTDMCEPVWDPGLSCLTSPKRARVEGADTETSSQFLTSPRSRLPDQRRTIRSHKPLEANQPEEAIGLSGLATARLALQHAARDPQAQINVNCENVDVGKDLAAALGSDSHGHPQTSERTLRKLNPGHAELQESALVEDR